MFMPITSIPGLPKIGIAVTLSLTSISTSRESNLPSRNMANNFSRVFLWFSSLILTSGSLISFSFSCSFSCSCSFKLALKAFIKSGTENFLSGLGSNASSNLCSARSRAGA